MKMTSEEYEKEIEIFNKLDAKVYWPTPEEIEIFESAPDKYIKYVLYLQHKLGKPKTKEEKYSKKNIDNFVCEYLEIEDEGVTIQELEEIYKKIYS